MKKLSLTKNILRSRLKEDGLLVFADGSLFRCWHLEPLSSGLFEIGFEGPQSDQLFQRLSDLLTRLPNGFEGQVLFHRRKLNDEISGFHTSLLIFERIKKPESMGQLKYILAELGLAPTLLSKEQWNSYVSSIFTERVHKGILPDLSWEKDGIQIQERNIKVLSLTELPQTTWNSCLQNILEIPCPFLFSLNFELPDRTKTRKKLDTKRRISHALSISSSLEMKNIESNSALTSTEETLERILIHKESLFEISMAVILYCDNRDNDLPIQEFEKAVSGVANAGAFLEGLGSLPIFRSHLPGEKILEIRKLPILSANLAHLLPLCLDFSRQQEPSSLTLRSRSEELSHLNLFSSGNLNFNAFICGASGSGKSFLMNALLSALLTDEPKTRICIFDIGGSYRKSLKSWGGATQALSLSQTKALIAAFLRTTPVSKTGFFQSFLETLCAEGEHLTHSHRVGLAEALLSFEGSFLQIETLIRYFKEKSETYYQDLAHWLTPHAEFDSIPSDGSLASILQSERAAFDFKDLESNPILQRTAILLISDLIWNTLKSGQTPRTLIVFDEVWRFFAQSQSFLEEMYRTLRKYRAGIVSITQNLADYGDSQFAKMIFTNSYTKLFLQNGASASDLKNIFNLPESDIQRALSVSSRKPFYSEFFALTPDMSQIFRLYPTAKLYELANTENITESEVTP